MLSGPWEAVLEAFNYAAQKKRELISPWRASRQGKKSERRVSPTVRQRDALLRLVVVAQDDGSLEVEPPRQIPYLLELLGDLPGANEGASFLVPVATVLRLERPGRDLSGASPRGRDSSTP